jgi:hypothetical protein
MISRTEVIWTLEFMAIRLIFLALVIPRAARWIYMAISARLAFLLRIGRQRSGVPGGHHEAGGRKKHSQAQRSQHGDNRLPRRG